jgi:hypothetical protein
MSQTVPHFALTHGQVMWCLAGGREPKPPLPHQVRYLRQLGIPFAEAEKGQGKGVRLTYNFYEFIELGVAQEAVRRGAAPRYLTQLADERTRYKSVYRQVYVELAAAPGLYDGDPRTRTGYDPEYLVRIRDRFSKRPGEIYLARQPEGDLEWRFGELVERFEGDELVVIQLKSLMASLLRLAKVAPETKPGPKG